jgi:hypothetical protein
LYAAFQHAGDLRARAAGHPEWTISEWLEDRQCFEKALAQLVQTAWTTHPDKSVTVQDFLRWLQEQANRAQSAALGRFVVPDPHAKQGPTRVYDDDGNLIEERPPNEEERRQWRQRSAELADLAGGTDGP